MKFSKRLFWALAALAALPVIVQASFTQPRYQYPVTIVVNVTNPLGRASQGNDASASSIVASTRTHRSGLTGTGFRSESLRFMPGSQIVAQTTAQKAVRVEAEVSPNPNATLLYSDNPQITVNANAGTTTFIPCAYHIYVKTTITYWSVKDGLETDFASNFPGGDLARNDYYTSSTPQPTATPFTVWADNGNLYANFDTSASSKTYCVDLTLTVPPAVLTGTYSSNAVYTIYY